MAQISTSPNPLYQSPHTYLQAVGHDGTDSYVKGHNVRWDLLKYLGNNHIPKGGLSGPSGTYPSSIGFSRTNDYVKLYKATLTSHYETKVDLTSNPDSVVESYNTKQWHYEDIVPNSGLPNNKNNATVKFLDHSAYNTTRQTYNPATDSVNFMRNYEGPLSVEIDGKLCYGIKIITVNLEEGEGITNEHKLETISLADTGDTNSTFLACREKHPNGDAYWTYCENVPFIRVEGVNSYIKEVHLATYEDFVHGMNNEDEGNGLWTSIGDFGLTLTDNDVYDRLEDTGSFTINDEWPKYNDESTTGGEYVVNVDNYKDRWKKQVGGGTTTDRLRDGVIEYLTLSEFDTRAEATLQSTGNDGSSMDMSYLDMLRIASIDFHIARMLGMGHIEADNSLGANDMVVFAMEYKTEAGLTEGASAITHQHLFLSMPTKISDNRFPAKPELDPVTYGIEVPNGTGNPTTITDSNGNSYYDDARFVNVNRKDTKFEADLDSFWASSTEFCICQTTRPVQYGIEYKKSGESSWRSPEILQDLNYTDTAGIPEVVGVPETGENKVYTHRETEEGIHKYALYAIDWFSRPSEVSTEVATDTTSFPKRATLIPPENFAVHLVQPEEYPYMMTSEDEQDELALLTTDSTLVRTTFEWNHRHHQPYQFADRVQLHFQEDLVSTVQGEILSVTDLTDNQVSITTTSYDLLSMNPVETIQPNVAASDAAKFVGSYLSCNDRLYEVVAVTSTGDDPTFTLKKIRETASMDVNNNNSFVTTEQYIAPAVGDRFLVAPNMLDGDHWAQTLNKEVYIEKFFLNWEVEIDNLSAANDGTYTVKDVELVSLNTDVTFHENLEAATASGTMKYLKKLDLGSISSTGGGTNNVVIVTGNVASEVNAATKITIEGSNECDGTYDVVTATHVSGSTHIEIDFNLPTNSDFGYVLYKVSATITGVDAANNKITLLGDYTAAILPPYQEEETNADGDLISRVIGGIVETATITERGDPIETGEFTGVYDIVFDTYELPDHIDTEVDWYGGLIRIMEDSSQFPQQSDPNYRAPRMKELRVWQVNQPGSGSLELVAYDTGFDANSGLNPLTDYMPIESGSNVTVNFHPGYRVYLKADTTSPVDFSENTILPAIGTDLKTTYMACRSKDSTETLYSEATRQVELKAAEVFIPEAPGDPSGPIFATRPDFYAKSTYTFDVEVNTAGGRRPYSVVFYRGSARRILDTLYTPATVATILDSLAGLAPDASHTDRWNGLANVVLEDPGPNEDLFKAYGGYRFPVPNNPAYVIPHADLSIADTPFDPPVNPGDNFDVTVRTGVTESTPMVDIIAAAIRGACAPLTEQPILYEPLQKGIYTSNRKPVFKTSDGRLLKPTDTDFDQAPMATRYVKDDQGAIIENPTEADLNNANYTSYVRFTDYTLDGASVEEYFYFGLEYTDKQEFGPASTLAGPVQLINALPPEPPKVRFVNPLAYDPDTNQEPDVQFTITAYNESENIVQIDLYRATTEADALSIRTMTLIDTFDWAGTGGTLIHDDFSSDSFVPYCAPLYYRLVARREVINEQGQTELVASLPSEMVSTAVVDTQNPGTPAIVAENGITTSTKLKDVVLTWERTMFNGTYYLEKQDSSGSWKTFYTTDSNNAVLQYPPDDPQTGTPDFTNYGETESLDREDENGNQIFHNYRVRAESCTGLFNLTESPLTLDQGCYDLLTFGPYVKYSDGLSNTLDPITNSDIDGSGNHPESMRFDGIVPATLPPGHTSFTSLTVSVEDNNGNKATKVITTATGYVEFADGDGDETGMALELTDPNRTYTIRTTLKTSGCTEGMTQTYTLRYIHGPCNELSKLAHLVKFQDDTLASAPLTGDMDINDGVDHPVEFQFKDDIDWTGLSQTFSSVEVRIEDSDGNVATKTITTAGGSVTFEDGDGDETGMALDLMSGNLEYKVRVIAKSTQCPDGFGALYKLYYSYTACEGLASLTDLVSYADDHSHSFNPLGANETVDTGVDHPTEITITDLIGNNLPAGHTFDKLVITIFDSIGDFHIGEITTAGGNLVITDADGIDLDTANLTYTVIVQLVTDECPAGLTNTHTIIYQVD